MTDKTTKRKAPAFQFYADDFLAGTLEMSQSDVGAYIRLLCHQWSRGWIPVDTEKQQRLAGGSFSVDVLVKFELLEDGKLVNRRLENERLKQEEFRQKQSAKGLASAEARKIQPKLNHGSTAVQPEGQPNTQPDGQPEGNSPSPSPYPSITPSPSITPIKTNLENNAYLGNTALTVQSRFTPPSKIELLEESNRIGLPETEAEKFEAFYESNGWKVGRNKMKSWKHALSGWKSRWSDNQLKGWGRELIGTSTPDDAAF